ncbi:MAG: hypothetical protein ACXADY_18760 [Candidatus Hodarchaeales archaeon]|jgi:hypothetical protein
MQTKPPTIKVKFENVPSFAVSGFFGGVNPNEGNVSFFQDRLIPRESDQPGRIVLETIEHNFVVNVKMSPAVFKRMALWMSEHVKRFESINGEIQLGRPIKKQQDQEPPSYYG